MENTKKEVIIKVIEKAYIEGVHKTQSESTIRSGFHEDFIMFVHKKDQVLKVGIDDWLERVEGLKKENPEYWKQETTYQNIHINITNYAASVKLDVFKGTSFFSTDYMLLYKFNDGWKIVSKIFTI